MIMGSRVRENPDRILECLVEVSAPKDPDSEPTIVRLFPENYEDEGALKQLPVFCFPYDTSSSYNPAGQLFTFVLTDIDGKYRYGFCRHPPGAQTCLCILSYLPWFEIFYKFLNTLGEMMCKKQGDEAMVLVDAFHCYSVPEPGTEVTIKTRIEGMGLRSVPISHQEFSFVAPDLKKLPTIPESRNITEYYNAVDIQNMMTLFASLLYERRVLVTSKKLSLLTAVIHGAATLLYPLYWQHIFIPVIPSKLLDYCGAPMPFLIGVHSSLMGQVRKKAADQMMEIVILDADNNTIETPFNDFESLPSEVTEKMKHRLKKTEKLLDDGVARIFLKALVPLLGGYRQALKLRQGEKITFDEEIFIQSKSTSMRRILEKMMTFQHVRQFVEGRLDMLNTGKGFSDVFEEECDQAELDKDKMKIMYKQWIKDTKNLMTTVKGKANPAMKQMYKQTKKKMQAVQNRFSHPKAKEVEDIPRSASSMGALHYLDTTDSSAERKSAPNSPTREKTRPKRPPPPRPPPFETYIQSQTRQRTNALNGSNAQTLRRNSKSKDMTFKSYNTVAIGDDESASDNLESSSSDESNKGNWQLMGEFDEVFNKLDKGLLNTNSDSSVQRGQYRHSVPSPSTRPSQRSTNDAFYALTSTNTPQGCPKEDEEDSTSAIGTNRNTWMTFDDDFSTEKAMKAAKNDTALSRSSGERLIDLASSTTDSCRVTVKRQPPVVPPRPVSVRKSVVKIEVTATSPNDTKPPLPASLIDSPLPLSLSNPQITSNNIAAQQPRHNYRSPQGPEYGFGTDSWSSTGNIQGPQTATSFNNPAFRPSNESQSSVARSNLPDLLLSTPAMSGSAPILMPNVSGTSATSANKKPGDTSTVDPFADLVSQTRASFQKDKPVDNQQSNNPLASL
ncbi:DENN domain-containing protein 1B-like isoform X5 [Ptychodera flava]|uniref:DENN domain-containing protein 1B-like isoform X5 n=1 Tax=Ptychodera flava TaxID=63121 RepID=UPI00396A1CBD